MPLPRAFLHQTVLKITQAEVITEVQAHPELSALILADLGGGYFLIDEENTYQAQKLLGQIGLSAAEDQS